MSFDAGLVSVTFRKLEPRAIVELVKRADLHGIEWGGDVHVPHGDLARARKVGAMTRDAGLEVVAYGSYYRAGESGDGEPEFASVLETACELGAPLVRVWAGRRGSAAADDAYRARVIDDLRRAVEAAAKRAVAVAVEYHANTLTDTLASARALLDEVSYPKLLTYWQPPLGLDEDTCTSDLAVLLGRLANLHVFAWRRTAEGFERLPLREGAQSWKRYFNMADIEFSVNWALLEFVRNDDPEQFLDDAAVLRRLLWGF